MLRDTKNVFIARERDVQRNRLRPSGLAVRVATKRLFPPCALIRSLRFWRWLFFLGLLLALFLLYDRLLHLWPPMFHVHKTSLVELDLCLAIALELD
jgi:hypothetical protein